MSLQKASSMSVNPINLADKLSMFSEVWTPKVVAELNDYQFKLAKFEGEFVWHRHSETDEAFIVLDGQLLIQLRDGDVELQSGEMYVVPNGVEHKPVAKTPVSVLLIEPRGVVNTGKCETSLTAQNDVWI